MHITPILSLGRNSSYTILTIQVALLNIRTKSPSVCSNQSRSEAIQKNKAKQPIRNKEKNRLNNVWDTLGIKHKQKTNTKKLDNSVTNKQDNYNVWQGFKRPTKNSKASNTNNKFPAWNKHKSRNKHWSRNKHRSRKKYWAWNKHKSRNTYWRNNIGHETNIGHDSNKYHGTNINHGNNNYHGTNNNHDGNHINHGNSLTSQNNNDYGHNNEHRVQENDINTARYDHHQNNKAETAQPKVIGVTRLIIIIQECIKPIRVMLTAITSMITKNHQWRTEQGINKELLRSRMSDVLKPEFDDFELPKMATGCYNIDEAEKMLRNSMAYKEKNHVKDLIRDYEPPEVLDKYLAGGLVGQAKDGSTLRVELYGRLDMRGIMNSVKKSDLEKTKILHCEANIEDWKKRSEQTGTRIDGLTVIFDMEGVGRHMLWTPGIQMYLHMVKILEDNYPEMLKRLLVINGNYQETLKKYIDDEYLPMCYGGTLTDPDGNPRCTTKICQGGTVPEEYYTLNTDYIERMENATIPKGDKLSKEYIVDISGSALRWEFMTQNHDIEFGVFYKQDSKKEAVKSLSKVNSHTITEDGFLTCDKTGVFK
ncbi:Retinal-binding protein [Mytilus edulis]|uniref:Retinal-binding protein n=1 Tax=Mytilus edulis TaxID=6550 RepID=A0A8S3PW46_MYTED|nr:Retinal-binding protein [Mytilus edulis]